MSATYVTSATTSATGSAPSVLVSVGRSARIRTALSGDTRAQGLARLGLLGVLSLVGTTVLVLLGTLLGGQAYISSVSSADLVARPATVVAAETVSVAEEREPATTSRVD